LCNWCEKMRFVFYFTWLFLKLRSISFCSIYARKIPSWLILITTIYCWREALYLIAQTRLGMKVCWKCGLVWRARTICSLATSSKFLSTRLHILFNPTRTVKSGSWVDFVRSTVGRSRYIELVWKDRFTLVWTRRILVMVLTQRLEHFVRG
jgi:hypothetical protein